jgi:bacillithiol biosynthesis cysteine-adding enzyme BshC
MKAMQINLEDSLIHAPLILDYLNGEQKLNPFITAFPDVKSFESLIQKKQFSAEHRVLLSNTLHLQYNQLHPSESVISNINSLRDEKTFTVTTGHQLCLFTGPLYFISKIASTIKLSQELKRSFPDNNFVPVFWMASEDHDFDEVSSVYFEGKHIKWKQTQNGPVGRMSAIGIASLISEIENNQVSSSWINLLNDAYQMPDLVSATRYLVDALFGKYGLVIIDGDDGELKKTFRHVFLNECMEGSSFHAVTSTNKKLKELGYETQVHPREINLFYLSHQSRERIVARGNGKWATINDSQSWDAQALRDEIEAHPENFSPNVVLRPLYQEMVLPNLAYVGGAGELAYWLQLKGVFDVYQQTMPLLVLRDHACILSERMESRMRKLNITFKDLFLDKTSLMRKVLPEISVNLSEEKHALSRLFEALAEKAGMIDSTLSAAVLAEGKRQESAIDQIAGKMTRAIKQREETKIRQLDKMLGEVFPEGNFQERYMNFFQFASATDDDLIDAMIQQFSPMENKLTTFFIEESQGKTVG